MSTLLYENTMDGMGYDFNIQSLVPGQSYDFTFLSSNCIGQDAGFIIRKRAMIVDLWNLLPQMPCSEKNYTDTANSYLPITINNSNEYWYSMTEKAIPVQ